MEFGIEKVLAASQTASWTLFSAPFANIVPPGSGIATPVTLKLQVKFHYSTASAIGIQTSPVYDVTLQQSVVTSFKLESKAETI